MVLQAQQDPKVDINDVENKPRDEVRSSIDKGLAEALAIKIDDKKLLEAALPKNQDVSRRGSEPLGVGSELLAQGYGEPSTAPQQALGPDLKFETGISSAMLKGEAPNNSQIMMYSEQDQMDGILSFGAWEEIHEDGSRTLGLKEWDVSDIRSIVVEPTSRERGRGERSEFIVTLVGEVNADGTSNEYPIFVDKEGVAHSMPMAVRGLLVRDETEVPANYKANRTQIDSLNPGETTITETGREWTKGTDGKLYYNCENLSDNMWLSFPGSEPAIGTSRGEMIPVVLHKVAPYSSGALLYHDQKSDGVFSETGEALVEFLPDVYIVPRPHALKTDISNFKDSDFVFAKTRGNGAGMRLSTISHTDAYRAKGRQLFIHKSLADDKALDSAIMKNKFYVHIGYLEAKDGRNRIESEDKKFEFIRGEGIERPIYFRAAGDDVYYRLDKGRSMPFMRESRTGKFQAL